MGSALPDVPFPNNLLKTCATREGNTLQHVLTVEYRLCRAEPLETAANPFPTQLIDGLTAYLYIIREIGFNHKDVILAGDSAGGNLVLALTRYLRDVDVLRASEDCVQSTPLGAILLFSPWTDLCDTHVPERSPLGQEASFVRNESADFVLRTTPERVGIGAYSIKGYCGQAVPLEELSHNPYVSWFP